MELPAAELILDAVMLADTNLSTARSKIGFISSALRWVAAGGMHRRLGLRCAVPNFSETSGPCLLPDRLFGRWNARTCRMLAGAGCQVQLENQMVLFAGITPVVCISAGSLANTGWVIANSR